LVSSSASYAIQQPFAGVDETLHLDAKNYELDEHTEMPHDDFAGVSGGKVDRIFRLQA
jgi:hypothetical protein